MFKEGETRLEMYKRIGKDLPQEPEIPDEIIHILNAFWGVNNLRQSNGFSLNPVRYSDLEDWQRGTGNLLTNDEIKIVMRLFSVFDEVAAEMQPKPEE